MAKLVEILARELKEWPEAVEAIEQDYEGLTLYSRRGQSLPICVSSIADDSKEGVVTRAEWQAAVDAMKCAVVPGRRYKVITGPAEWNENINLIGTQVVVLFTFKNVLGQNLAVIERNGGECSCLILECLEPLPSQDQIDALERERIQDEIQRICTDGENSGVPFFKALYDAGYRKQEPK